jgi:hypothetical protein
MKALQIAAEEVAAQINEVIKTTDKYIEACMRPDCGTYLTSTYKRLPRELRDMVYGFMIGQDAVHVRGQDFLKLGASSGHVEAAPTHVSSEPFWDAMVSGGYGYLSRDHLDPGITRELAETFYSIARHRFVAFHHVQQYMDCKIVSLD